MAFKDLQREVLEEFAGSALQDDQTLERRPGSRKRASKKQESKSRSDFLAKLTRRRYLVPVLEPAVACAVCRQPCSTTKHLTEHYEDRHPAAVASQRPASASSRGEERAQLVAAARRLERQLEAARGLVVAIEQRLVRLVSKLRGI